MSRYLSADELFAVADRNGLKVEREPYTGALMLRRKTGKAQPCGVLYGPQGLIDWHATAHLVLVCCFGRGATRA